VTSYHAQSNHALSKLRVNGGDRVGEVHCTRPAHAFRCELEELRHCRTDITVKTFVLGEDGSVGLSGHRLVAIFRATTGDRGGVLQVNEVILTTQEMKVLLFPHRQYRRGRSKKLVIHAN